MSSRSRLVNVASVSNTLASAWSPLSARCLSELTLASFGRVSLKRRVSEKSTLVIAPLASVVAYPPEDLIAKIMCDVGLLISGGVASSAVTAGAAILGVETEACLIAGDPTEDDSAGGALAGCSDVAGASGFVEEESGEVFGDFRVSIVCSSCWIFWSISFSFFFMISGS